MKSVFYYIGKDTLCGKTLFSRLHFGVYEQSEFCIFWYGDIESLAPSYRPSSGIPAIFIIDLPWSDSLCQEIKNLQIFFPQLHLFVFSNQNVSNRLPALFSDNRDIKITVIETPDSINQLNEIISKIISKEIPSESSNETSELENDLIQKYHERFFQKLPERISELQQSIDTIRKKNISHSQLFHNIELLKINGHKMKGSGMTFLVPQAAKTGAEIEMICKKYLSLFPEGEPKDEKNLEVLISSVNEKLNILTEFTKNEKME